MIMMFYNLVVQTDNLLVATRLTCMGCDPPLEMSLAC